jgi:hypothetical protein
MDLRIWVPLLLFVTVTPAVAESAIGPSAPELSAAIATFANSPQRFPVRNVHCIQLGDPTEFSCRYHQRGPQHQWKSFAVDVAISGAGWSLIDTPYAKKAS